MDRAIFKLFSRSLHFKYLSFFVILCWLFSDISYSQSYDALSLDLSEKHQVLVGFGGSLAYYENWVTAHPNRDQIYEALFGELGLDILRLRNAHGYDAGMIGRAKEFVQAAETVRGTPISVLTTSWGPPAELKSNNDRNKGGTLRYTVNDGKVEFDYAGFAQWWNSSLDEYNANGIFPDYVGIQNEPDWTADYESCRLNPKETINATDTIAGYNLALEAVYDSIQTRAVIPSLIGPENIGIGYNSVENYCNEMDLSRIGAIAHHLYHGANEEDPYSSTNYKKVGDYHPEIPHFQTEYSRAGWWSDAGMIYMSLCVENVSAYLYWDLAWNDGGLIDVDFPWDRSRWEDPATGYTRTKDFYAFKQYSAFIHPGWVRVSASGPGENAAITAFMSPDEDSAAIVLINRSETEELVFNLAIPGYSIDRADLYVTSETENCEYKGDKKDQVIMAGGKSITTLSLSISESLTQIPVDSVVLNPGLDSILIRKGSLAMNTMVYPEDASQKAVYYELIENKPLAEIDQEGILTSTGVADGFVRVRASATDGSGISADTLIYIINQVWVNEINVILSEDKIDEPGGSIQITATALPEEAYNRELSWEIINGSGIASLSVEGILQATGTGDGMVLIRISATDGSGFYEEISVPVTNQIPVSEIVLDASDTVINTAGGSLQILATVLPENASIKSLIWSLEEGINLAQIDQNGLLTAVGGEDGRVLVRATSEAFPEIHAEISIRLQNQQTSVEHRPEKDFHAWYASGSLNYRIPSSDRDWVLSIYTIEGTLVKIVEINSMEVEGSIDLGGIHDGIYLVSVRNNKNFYHTRLRLH